MQIRITGKQMEVGDFLRAHVEGKTEEGVNKYLDRVNDVNVVFHKENHIFHCDISLNTGTHSHMTVKSSAEASDAYVAFDIAAERMEKQLRRYKRKLKSHTEARKASEENKEFTKYVLSGHVEEVPEEGHAGLVIAEQNYALFSMTVSEAVMRMDLENLPALMFLNSAHGGINVVYRRKDGNIAWLDPRIANDLGATIVKKAKAKPVKKTVAKEAKAKPTKKAAAKKPAAKKSKAKPAKKVAAKKAVAKKPVKKVAKKVAAKKPVKKAVKKVAAGKVKKVVVKKAKKPVKKQLRRKAA